TDMITEIITFNSPDGMTRGEVVANYRRSASSWRANPDLIRKNYLYDAASRRPGGVFLWRTMDGRAAGAECGVARTGSDHLRQQAGRAVFRDAHRGGQCPGQDDRRGGVAKGVESRGPMTEDRPLTPGGSTWPSGNSPRDCTTSAMAAMPTCSRTAA